MFPLLLWVGAGALVGVSAIAGILSGRAQAALPAGGGVDDGGRPGVGGDREAERLQLRALARRAAAAVNNPQLVDFLEITAKGESGFNPRAMGPTDDRGLFQLIPMTAFPRQLWSGRPVDLLFDPRWSVLLATHLYHRLRKYGGVGQTIDYGAMRRGWAVPTLLRDTSLEEAKSRRTINRMRGAIRNLRFDPRVERAVAFPSGHRWPGMVEVAKAVGISERELRRAGFNG